MLIGLIYYLKLNHDNTSFHIERSIIFSFLFESMVYIVLLAYLVVRFVLYTRLIAFPPLKDITYNEYIKVTDLNNSNYNFLLYMVLGLLASRLIYLVITTILNKRLKTIKLKNNKVQAGLLALSMLLSVILTFTSNTKFIFLNILTPLFVFIISDYFFSKLLKKDSNEFLRRLLSIAISIIIGGVLLLFFDKGYLLIYILFVVTYTTLILLFYFFKENKKLAVVGLLLAFLSFSFLYTNVEKGGIVSDIFKYMDSHRIAYRFDILNKDIGELLIDNEYQSNQSRLQNGRLQAFGLLQIIYTNEQTM